jgi:aminopeptidase N
LLFLKKYSNISIIILFGLFYHFLTPDLSAQDKICGSFERFDCFSVITDSTIDIKYYELNLKVNLNPNYIQGNASIFLEPVISGISHFYLSLSNNLIVDSIKQDSISLNYIHLNDKLTITLNKLPKNKNAVNVKIYYHGLPVPTGFGSFIFGVHSNQPVIWSLSEPYGAMDWFPCKNSPEDKIDSVRISVTCLNDLIAVSNGLLKNIIQNSDSTKTYIWKTNYPLSDYLISVAITNFTEYINYWHYDNNDSMLVIHYIYPEQFSSLKSQLDKTGNMLQIFSELFGMYPFKNEKYGHAQFQKQGGMEHQTISSMGYFNDGIMAHELSHQWFGDLITCDKWNNIWLHEGFATFSEALYLEKSSGTQAYKDFMRSKLFDAKKASGTLFIQDISQVSEIFNYNKSYAKGSAVIYMLRNIIGDTLFFKSLKKFVSDTAYRFKNASTENFFNAVQNTTGYNLSYFMNEWVYGEGYPKYIINWTSTDLTNEKYKVNLTLSQIQNINPQFFEMPVEVLIKTKEKDTIFTLYNNSLSQNYYLTVNGKPELITFDPGEKILKEKTGDDPVVLISYYLSQNYPNPFNPSTKIEYGIAKYENVNISVFDITGKEIRILVNRKEKPGNYSVLFDAENLPAGIYFYRILTDSFSESRKLVFIK